MAAIPATARVSHMASPIHMARRNGRTSLRPLVRMRATIAAMLGPGDPAATINAATNTNKAERLMVLSSCLMGLHQLCKAGEAKIESRLDWRFDGRPKAAAPIVAPVDPAAGEADLLGWPV